MLARRAPARRRPGSRTVIGRGGHGPRRREGASDPLPRRRALLTLPGPAAVLVPRPGAVILDDIVDGSLLVRLFPSPAVFGRLAAPVLLS